MAMMIKQGCVVMLLSVFIQMSLSAQNDSKSSEEKPEFEQLATQSSTNTTEEPSIAHGCPTIRKHADDDGENKTRLTGYCLDGICYPTDHDNVTHLPTPENPMLG
uniref:Putative evasin n=1 Tax=Rhipicephalus microplus TaxID=6941 RepID=A0A6G5A0R6_RHIMP